MGLFSGITALKEMKRIRAGGKGKLSLAQVTNLIINLPDAKKNLSQDQFKTVLDLFNKMQKCTTKFDLDLDGYYETAVKIIQQFDALAPYEKYSGGNEIETSFLMSEIRGASKNIEALLDLSMYCNPKDAEDDIQMILKESNKFISCVSREDAEAIIAVGMCNQIFGKETALKAFDALVKSILHRGNDGLATTMEISFLAGALCPSKVLTKDESDALAKKYTQPILDKMQNNSKCSF